MRRQNGTATVDNGTMFPKILHIELPHDPAVSPLGKQMKELTTGTGTCILMFTAASFIRAKGVNNPNVHHQTNVHTKCGIWDVLSH